MNLKSVQGSSYRDRTQEFISIAERLRKSLSSLNGSSKADGSRSKVAFQTEFNKRASKIGYGIHQTSQKLAKLAKCELMIECDFSNYRCIVDYLISIVGKMHTIVVLTHI